MAQETNPCGMRWSEMLSAIHNNEGGVMYAVQYSKCTAAGVCGWPKVALQHTFPYNARISLRLRGLTCDGNTNTAGFNTAGDEISPNSRYVDQGNWHTFKQVTEVVRVEVSYEKDGDRYEIIYDKDRGINKTTINGKSIADYNAEKTRKQEADKASLTGNGNKTSRTTSSATTKTTTYNGNANAAKKSSSTDSYYNPVPLTQAQQYSVWLQQYSNNLIREQQIASEQYSKAQDAVQSAFAGNVSTRQGLQNLQQSMGSLAQSQDMSTASGRTRAVAYGVESLAAGIGSLLVKEHDYEAEARAAQRMREARAAAQERSDEEKEKITGEINNYISGDLIWLLAKAAQSAEKILLFNSINTRSMRKAEVDNAGIYDRISVGYGTDTLVDFQTGMPRKLWNRFDALNPELSSAFVSDPNGSDFHLFDKKMHTRALKGKYGEYQKNYYRGITALFFNDKHFKIKKSGPLALSWLQKAANDKYPGNTGNALDAMGEIYYDSAMRSGNMQALQQAFELFSQSIAKEPSRKTYHNLFLAGYKLITADSINDKEKYFERCRAVFYPTLKHLANNNAGLLGRQAADFVKQKDYAAALRLYRILIDTNYVSPKNNEFALSQAYMGLGNCYANGWGVERDTGAAVGYYYKGMEKGAYLAADAIEKIRDPQAYAEKHALNHLYYQNIPARLSKLLDSCATEKVIDEIQLTASGSYITQAGGIILSDRIPEKFATAVSEAGNPKQIYLSPDSKAWAVLHGKNYYNTEGLPATLLNKMGEYYRDGKEIRHIALSEDGAWVMLSGKNGCWWNGIPSAMANALNKLNERSSRIDYITFQPGGGWLIIYDSYGYWHGGISDQVIQKVDEYNTKKRTIHYIVFSSRDSFLIN
ncbi:hypothetical protein GCM10023143_17150 [Compostibacter hankyongensis]|uniref:Sel1 repeat family protein n=2 Tax=Compostibacter hankyongensis TaxID=1007089 RepID=A0ABP8FR20_9BACT